MSRTLQFKRYANTVVANITGADGELIVDKTNNILTIHDGVTPGGHPAVAAVANDTTARTTSQAAFIQANAAFQRANTGTGGNTANITFLNTTIGTLDANTDIVLSTILVDPTASPAINIVNSWTFGKDGKLTVPNSITGLKTSENWTDTITAIDLGTETIITLSNNHFGGPIAGQVVISGVNSPGEVNATWYYQAWNSNQIRLFNDVNLNEPIDSTSWAAYDGGGSIFDITGGGVSIEANYNTWEFSSNGNFYAPGNIVVGGGNNTNGNEQHLIIDSSNYWTSIQWKNFTEPQDPNNTPFECQAQLLRVFGTDSTVTAWCNVNNPREELVALTAIRPTTTNYNGLMFSTSDTKIPDAPYNDGAGTRYDWILHGDGTTQLPNMPTNARTGNADALIFTKMNGRTGQKVIGTQAGTVDNPTVERLVIAGGDSFDTGEGYQQYSEGGDIYLWAGRGANGGDIKVDAGNSYGGNNDEGGTIKIRGGNSSTGVGGFVQIDSGTGGTNGGDIEINASSGAVDGGDINISAGYGGSGFGGQVTIAAGTGGTASGIVRVTTNYGNWDFGSDGLLTFPNGSAFMNKQRYGMGDLVAYHDGHWVLGEHNGDDFGTIGMRIAPGIEGANELILPSNSLSANNPVELNNYENGGVKIRSGSNTWTFGADSSLTIPGEIKSANSTGNVTIHTNDGTEHTWTFSDTGNLILPGAIINATANTNGTGDPAYPTALDLTKTINKLSINEGSWYTLADGVEGQIMHLVSQTGGTRSVYVVIHNARILNDVTSTATVFNDAWYYPFTDASVTWSNNIATLIFTDGAWNVSTGSWDY